MNVDFSQFRNNDISLLLTQAAQMAHDLSLRQVETSVFFVTLQQHAPAEMARFFNAAGVDEAEFYGAIGNLINNAENATDSSGMPLSQELIETLMLTLNIEQQIHECSYEHGCLIAALFVSHNPLRGLAQRFGITSDKVLRIITTPRQTVTPQQTTTVSTWQSESNQQQPIPSPPQQQNPGNTQQPSGNTTQRTNTKAEGCPTVCQFGTDMLEKARKGQIEPVIGREEEIKRLLQILARKTKSNPVLVGEPGTGKTAIIEGLAHKLLNNEVPQELAQLKLYQLDLPSITNVSNATEIVQKLIEELREHSEVVIFLDEIHTIISSNAGADNPIANLLKPEMARGTIKIVGATTNDEYTKHIEKDKAFERRFQKVIVDEPDAETAEIIVKGVARRLEAHHNISIPENISKLAVTLSLRYITDRRLPDKAIDLIDEAAACARLNRQAAMLEENDIRDVVTRWTGIPVSQMDEDNTERLRHIEEELHKSVIGQEKAIKAVANAIRRSRMGLSDESKPIGSFLFLGTTGVGKTELSKALAEFLFHSRNMMVRIDMSEYQQEHSSARLFGAPPGYVGYEQGGQLTEAVRRKPYSIVLFDEIEKAHPKIYETLLQILDDGRMTDGQGRVVDFRNTVIIMTSNIGQTTIMNNLSGTNADDEKVGRTTELVLGELRQRVAPEFINRIDNIIMFMPLTFDDIRKIAHLQLENVKKQMLSNNIRIGFSPAAEELIARKGFQPQYGARPVKRVINSEVKDAVINAIMEGSIDKSKNIYADASGNDIVFENINVE